MAVIYDTDLWPKLLASAQNGDGLAYQKFLGEAFEMLCGFIRRRVNDSAMAQDIAQECLIGIHRALHTYDPTKPIIPWITAIAKYKIADYYRKASKSSALEVLDDDILVQKPVPHSMEMSLEMQLEIDEALDLLSPKQRKIVTMLKIQGFSLKQVASQLDMTVSAVKVAAHRAYQKLRGGRSGENT